MEKLKRKITEQPGVREGGPVDGWGGVYGRKNAFISSKNITST